MDHVEDVFRRSSPAIIASLTRAVGPSRLDLVEAVVQDAFVRALEEWRSAPPANPAGWLREVAKNLAIDHLRRERTFRAKEAAVAQHLEAGSSAGEPPRASLQGELADERLTMIFVACHPANTTPSQIALCLRTLCGFDVPAIARALYATEDAIEKRLVLARRRLRDAAVSFELPPVEELGARLDAVLRVLYLVFNEAYWGTSGPDVVDQEVATEAISLVEFLARRSDTRRPSVLALLALMRFQAARFPARVSPASRGEPLSLAEQDRSLWDAAQIAEAIRCLAASAEGDEASAYHFEAAIAAVHATSASYEATDWARIVEFYDRLVAVAPSPSARLSRAIAIGLRDGPGRGLEALGLLGEDASVASMAAFEAALADAHARLGDHRAARAAYETARARSSVPHERRWIERRLSELPA